jgi:hypothetical protein
MASCGSYQNTSYYDNDGIGTTSNQTSERTVQNTPDNQYGTYFNSQNDYQTTETFTDVDTYSDYDLQNDTTQENYCLSRLGGNPQSVNVYDGWGMNNWGMNNWE